MKYYIYVYLNPLKPCNYVYKKFEFDYEPFYIGLGKKKRIDQHIINARYKEKNKLYKTLKDNIILKILKNEQKPIRYKLYENVTLESAIRLEKYLIKLIGRRDLGIGSLANLTDGGEGMIGFVYSEIQIENRKKLIKEFWKRGVFDNRKISGKDNHFYNKHHTEETKEKIRKSIGNDRKGEKNANYGKKWTKEMKNSASIKQKETHINFIGENNPAKREDVRKKLSDGKIGLLNPNAKKWLLISPKKEEFIIDGGIKRNLKIYNLDYQSFVKLEHEEKTRINTKGWILKEI